MCFFWYFSIATLIDTTMMNKINCRYNLCWLVYHINFKSHIKICLLFSLSLYLYLQLCLLKAVTSFIQLIILISLSLTLLLPLTLWLFSQVFHLLFCCCCWCCFWVDEKLLSQTFIFQVGNSFHWFRSLWKLHDIKCFYSQTSCDVFI